VNNRRCHSEMGQDRRRGLAMSDRGAEAEPGLTEPTKSLIRDFETLRNGRSLRERQRR